MSPWLRAVISSQEHWITRGILVGVVWCIVQESYYYSMGGCADEREARQEHGHAISNQMCCTPEWIMSSIGLIACSMCIIMGLPRVFRLNSALGRCCCCVRGGMEAGRWIAILLGLATLGLITLSIAQMCWSLVVHAVGAVLFFGCGFVTIFMANLSAPLCQHRGVQQADLDTDEEKADGCRPNEQHEPPQLEMVISAEEADTNPPGGVVLWHRIALFWRIFSAGLGVVTIPIVAVDPYIGEWFAVGAIAAIVVHVQAVVTLDGISTEGKESDAIHGCDEKQTNTNVNTLNTLNGS